MFQPEVRGVVTERKQKVVFAIVPRAVKRPSLRDQALVLVDGWLRHLQRGISIRDFVDVVLDRAFRRKRNAAEMRPGQHRRIHQRGQRYLLEIDLACRFTGHRQCGAELPASGQLQRRNDRNIVSVLSWHIHIKHHLVPAQHVELRSCRSAGRKTFRRRRHYQVQRCFQRAHALGHSDVKFVHLVQIAPPLQPLPVGKELHAGQVSDWSGRPMFAGNPFGKNQLHLARGHRNLQLRMQDFFRRVRGIDHELDGLCWRARSGLRLSLLRECGKRDQA